MLSSVKASVARQDTLSKLPTATSAIKEDDPFDGMYVSRSTEAIVRRERHLEHRLDFRIQIAVDVCHTSPTHLLDVDKIAAHVYLSPSRFRHLFTEQMGLSFHQYLIGLRLWTAHTLLLEGSFDLAEVRRLTGLADPSHFAREYKRCYGVPPGASRNQAALRRLAGQFGSTIKAQGASVTRPLVSWMVSSVMTPSQAYTYPGGAGLSIVQESMDGSQ